MLLIYQARNILANMKRDLSTLGSYIYPGFLGRSAWRECLSSGKRHYRRVESRFLFLRLHDIEFVLYEITTANPGFCIPQPGNTIISTLEP